MATPARRAPAPAFTRQSPAEKEGVEAALGVIERRGLSVTDSGTYHADQTLRVLVGSRMSPDGGHAQQAFFFDDGRYLGTDSSQSSAAITVLGQSDTEVTLAYALYRQQDAPCCPKGGEATVRFELNDGHLQALDPIPPANSAGVSSRR